MSLKGLERSERLAASLSRKIELSFRKQLDTLKQELAKVEYLLGDPVRAQEWAGSQIDGSRLSVLQSLLSQTEQLYIQGGDTPAAKLFHKRMTEQLQKRLTNLKANELELRMRIEQSKNEVGNELLTGLSDVKKEGALTEMFEESKQAGGFLSNVGRAYLGDLVTFETKAAGSKTLGEYMSNLYKVYESGLRDVFVDGIIRGESYDAMAAKLSNTTGVTIRKAKLLVNTESNAIFNQSVLDVIQDNELVKGYRFRAVLDSHTSKLCQEHDGEFIPKDKVEPGVNYPPLHPNCRSTVTTVLVGEDEKKDQFQRWTKNKMNQWEKVPPGMKYPEFKDKFGFSNSKNPKTYSPQTRSIYDVTLASITDRQYKGYVKPSVSSVARINKMVKDYAEGEMTIVNAAVKNTGMPSPAQAMLRQAQAEAGFDGLPLQLTAGQFDKQVEDNGYIKVYRKFGHEKDLKDFIQGDQPYLKSGADIHGTKVFLQQPEDMDGVVEMAIKTPINKILVAPSRQSVREGVSGDSRIDIVLSQAPESKRSAIFSSMAIEYGYDAVRFDEEGYLSILNRTSVLVKQPQLIEVPEPELDVVKYSQTVKRLEHIAGNDPRIVKPKEGPKYVPNVIASAVKLDHFLPASISSEARAIYSSAIRNEKKLTDALLKVVDGFEGARLDGIEFCVKTGSSTQSKIARNIAKVLKNEDRVIDDVEAIKMMDDLNRYTVVLPENGLAEGTLSIVDELEASGFEITEIDNKYLLENTAYKAIHLQARTPEGTLLEVQMHTDADLAIKAAAHPIYELQRELKDKDSLEWQLYQNQMVNMYSKLPDPKDVRKIKTFKGGKK